MYRRIVHIYQRQWLNLTGINQDKFMLTYPVLKKGTGYVASAVQLEFGARATGEPHAVHKIESDVASWIKEVIFPVAQPLVMAAERTFWEKATAAHVYCLQQKMRGERYSRHWFDLVALANSDYYEIAIANAELAAQVAAHKTMFFSEKDVSGIKINYHRAVSGALQLVPEKEAYQALLQDYAAMREDGLLCNPPEKSQQLFIENSIKINSRSFLCVNQNSLIARYWRSSNKVKMVRPFQSSVESMA